MLPVALVTDRDCYNRRPPIPYEPLCSSIEDWLAADNLGSSAVDLI